MTKATVLGKDFKEMVAAVRRFPSVGTFAGAGLVHLAVGAGKLTGSHMGVVSARARVPADGELPLTGVDERNIDGFAPLCADDAKVTLTLTGSELVMRCKDREQTVPITEVQPVKISLADTKPILTVSDTLALRISYLSAVAHSDTSRAELCCVMLTADGAIMACSQKIIAVLEGEKLAQDVAIPLALAKALVTGDKLLWGPKEIILQSGIATYAIPIPAKAQAEFPSAKLREFAQSKRTKVATVEGDKFSNALQDCVACLRGLASVEVILDVAFAANVPAEVGATNGGTRFKAKMPVLSLTKDGTFKAPLTEVSNVAPFMTSKVTFSVGEHGDLFLGVSGGFIWFPAWAEGKKK